MENKNVFKMDTSLLERFRSLRTPIATMQDLLPKTCVSGADFNVNPPVLPKAVEKQHTAPGSGWSLKSLLGATGSNLHSGGFSCDQDNKLSNAANSGKFSSDKLPKPGFTLQDAGVVSPHQLSFTKNDSGLQSVKHFIAQKALEASASPYSSKLTTSNNKVGSAKFRRLSPGRRPPLARTVASVTSAALAASKYQKVLQSKTELYCLDPERVPDSEDEADNNLDLSLMPIQMTNSYLREHINKIHSADDLEVSDSTSANESEKIDTVYSNVQSSTSLNCADVSPMAELHNQCISVPLTIPSKRPSPTRNTFGRLKRSRYTTGDFMGSSSLAHERSSPEHQVKTEKLENSLFLNKKKVMEQSSKASISLNGLPSTQNLFPGEYVVQAVKEQHGLPKSGDLNPSENDESFLNVLHFKEEPVEFVDFLSSPDAKETLPRSCDKESTTVEAQCVSVQISQSLAERSPLGSLQPCQSHSSAQVEPPEPLREKGSVGASSSGSDSTSVRSPRRQLRPCSRMSVGGKFRSRFQQLVGAVYMRSRVPCHPYYKVALSDSVRATGSECDLPRSSLESSPATSALSCSTPALKRSLPSVLQNSPSLATVKPATSNSAISASMSKGFSSSAQNCIGAVRSLASYSQEGKAAVPLQQSYCSSGGPSAAAAASTHSVHTESTTTGCAEVSVGANSDLLVNRLQNTSDATKNCQVATSISSKSTPASSVDGSPTDSVKPSSTIAASVLSPSNSQIGCATSPVRRLPVQRVAPIQTASGVSSAESLHADQSVTNATVITQSVAPTVTSIKSAVLAQPHVTPIRSPCLSSTANGPTGLTNRVCAPAPQIIRSVSRSALGVSTGKCPLVSNVVSKCSTASSSSSVTSFSAGNAVHSVATLSRLPSPPKLVQRVLHHSAHPYGSVTGTQQQQPQFQQLQTQNARSLTVLTGRTTALQRAPYGMLHVANTINNNVAYDGLKMYPAGYRPQHPITTAAEAAPPRQERLFRCGHCGLMGADMAVVKNHITTCGASGNLRP